MLEEKKEGPNKTISETTANKWQGCMIANIKKEEKWLPFLSPKIWQPKKITNRGLTGADALKGVSSGHKSVTSILPNNPTMLPLFSLFMNFPPIMSGSHSGLIIRFELPPHQDTTVTMQ